MSHSDTKHDRTNPCNQQNQRKHQNALLTFAGEQDTEFFAAALKAVSEMSVDESGGSRELSVRADGDRIIIGYKMELDI